MSDPSDIPPEDRDLFRKSVGRVKPIRQKRQLLVTPRPEAKPIQTEQDQLDVLQEMAEASFDTESIEAGEELFYYRPGIQQPVMRQLRRGYYVIQGELDLHGMTSDNAKQALAAFLSESIHRGRRCVRIIHGKGRGSPHGKPVLKNKVNQWLQLRREVLAFCSAPPADGGTGALYVLLKQRERSDARQ